MPAMWSAIARKKAGPGPVALLDLALDLAEGQLAQEAHGELALQAAQDVVRQQPRVVAVGREDAGENASRVPVVARHREGVDDVAVHELAQLRVEASARVREGDEVARQAAPGGA